MMYPEKLEVFEGKMTSPPQLPCHLTYMNQRLWHICVPPILPLIDISSEGEKLRVPKGIRKMGTSTSNNFGVREEKTWVLNTSLRSSVRSTIEAQKLLPLYVLHVKRFLFCFANGIEISNPLRVRREDSLRHQCMHNLPLDRNSLLLLCHRKGFHHLLQQPAAPILCYLLSSIYLAQTRWAWHFVIQVDFCSFLIPSWSSGMSIDFFFNWQLITCKAGKIDSGEERWIHGGALHHNVFKYRAPNFLFCSIMMVDFDFQYQKWRFVGPLWKRSLALNSRQIIQWRWAGYLVTRVLHCMYLTFVGRHPSSFFFFFLHLQNLLRHTVLPLELHDIIHIF